MRTACLLAMAAAVSAPACGRIDQLPRADGGFPEERDAPSVDRDASIGDAEDEAPSRACDRSKPSSCGPGFFCDSFLPGCSGTGECRPVADCSLFRRMGPVCGCDGTIYASTCEAAAAGIALAPAETCSTDEKLFPCGPELCNPLYQLCSRTARTEYRQCRQSPPECFAKTVDSLPDCACWPEAGSTAPTIGCYGCRIVGTKTLGLEVNCPAPVP